MRHVLKTYLKRLINLSSGNKSLLLLNLPKPFFLDLKDLNFIKEKSSFELLELIIAKKSKIPICDIQDPRSDAINEISKQLTKIQRNQKSIEEESGKKELFLGYPFLEGKTMDGALLRSPLLFFPLDLVVENNTWLLRSRPDEIQFNLSLITALSHNSGPKLEALDELGLNDYAGNSLEFRTTLYELIKEHNLAINFNSEIFKNELQYFLKTTKADFEQNTEIGELKLHSKAVLGLFPQGGSFLINDYHELIAQSEEDFDFEKIFENSSKRNVIKEENLLLPFDIDGSQEAAIIKVKSGQSINIQGPPGTGKSQLICNLVTDYIANNKKVLVVCKKRAALDTIYERMASLNLNRNLALVHDFKADRRLVLIKIIELIEQIPEIERANKSLDAVFIEREFYQTSRSIEQICRELDTFKNALFDDSICQLSVKELYLIRNNKVESIDLGPLFLEFKFKEISEFNRKLAELEFYDTKTGINNAENKFFQDRKSFKDLQNSDLKLIESSLNELLPVLEKHEKQFKNISINESLGLNIDKFKSNYENLTESELSEFKKFDLKSNHFKVKELEIEIDFLSKNKLLLNDLFDIQLPRESILNDALIASKGMFSKQIFRLSKKYKNTIKPLLKAFNLKFNFNDLDLLQIEISKLLIWKDYISKYKAIIDFSDQHNYINNLEKYKNYLFLKESTPNSIFLFVLEHYKEIALQVLSLSTWVSKLQDNITKLNSYFTLSRYSNLKSQHIQDLIFYIDSHFYDIQQKDRLLEELNFSERKVYNIIKSKLNYEESFEQSLVQHWIDHIETKNTILIAASSSRLDILEQQLSTLIEKKQNFSLQMIQLKLAGIISDSLEKNRLGNVVSFRDLLHQASKKRGLWPLRKIIKHFESEVFKLLPCWLVSPETSSAIFSADLISKFDLVIFDEASQCFPEEGIPSILKGNQLVVVGDKMQLQPNVLYKTRFEEVLTIEEPLLEVESLVQLAERYLPSTILNHHYRSRYPSLISFSNNYFYKNKLKTLPDFKDVGHKAIEIIKVDGVWDNQTNSVEALKVVEILKLLPVASKIGVVTFNFKQSELIYEIAEAEKVLNNNISIKNIENIQGDEFDIVIFSMAYALDSKGVFKHSFGSLNQKGGENRLNVAISRAREKIIIVTSISSHDLQVDQSLNLGPKLLKSYLEYAENLGNNKDVVFKEVESSSKSLASIIKINENILYCNYHFADLQKDNTLICTDDKLFFESESAKAYYVYNATEIKRKGWNISLRWSRENLKKQI